MEVQRKLESTPSANSDYQREATNIWHLPESKTVNEASHGQYFKLALDKTCYLSDAPGTVAFGGKLKGQSLPVVSISAPANLKL